MAIYPYTNTYVINKDAVAGSSFKAGMVLMMNASIPWGKNKLRY
jgi:hypothetical protein